MENVLQQVVSICQKSAPPEFTVLPTTSLVRDLGFDSLQALELISEVETSFGVGIPAELLPEIDTIADVANLIVRVQNTPGCK